MIFQEILHLTVLALSLATVLVTLLTYLLFKIRQLPKSQKEQEASLDGRYFRRYIPGKRFAADPAATAAAAVADTEVRRYQWRTLPVFFAVLAIILFVALGAGHYALNLPGMSPVNVTPLTFAEAQKQGLLKEYELDTSAPALKLKEYFSPQAQAQYENVMTELRGAQIAVWKTASAEAANPIYVEAQRAWHDYLEQLHMRHAEVDSLEGVEADVLVIPQAKSLSPAQREELAAWVAAGKSVLATGPIGTMNTTGEVDAQPLTESVFGVKMLANPLASEKSPTIFAGNKTPAWRLPPGILLDWQPIEDSQVAISINPQAVASAFAANYIGRLRTAGQDAPVVRANFLNHGNARLIWLALDPITDATYLKENKFYTDLAMAQALSWASHRLSASLANWPNGVPSAVVMSVDSEDKFSGAFALAEAFHANKIPATFFIVANELGKDSKLMTLKDPNLEYASHTVDHKLMDKMSLSDQFAEMQLARFEIEKYGQVQVDGFRPPEEIFNDDTLQAALQNHVRYFFGDQHFSRLAPVTIADGQMTFFPRTVLDDFNLTKFHSFEDSKSLTTALDHEISRAEQLGGGAFFSFHSQVFGQAPMVAWVGEFLKAHRAERTWFANFRQVAAWGRSREAVTVLTTTSLGGDSQIAVQNTAASETRYLALQVDRPSADLTLPPNAKAYPGYSADSTLVLLPPLAAGEKVVIAERGLPTRTPSSVSAKPKSKAKTALKKKKHH